MTQDYSLSYLAICVVLVTLLIQAMVAAITKAKQPGAVPGKIDPSLSHESFTFRAHRTFMNSLENMPLFLGTAFVAILASVNPRWTALLLALFAVARIGHMVLFYVIATEKNPSPRSYFYLLGLAATVALLALTLLELLQRLAG